MIYRLALAFFALLMPLAVHAQSLEGTWDFRIDGATVFRFEIEEGQDGEWLGEWSRPENFNTDGNNFANMGGGVKSTPSMTGIEFLGMVELSFDDPRPGAIPDIFRFDLTGDDTAEMTYVGTELEPYQLVRSASADAMGNWDAARIYRRRLAPVQAQQTEDESEADMRVITLPTVNFIDLGEGEEVTDSAQQMPPEPIQQETEALPPAALEPEPDPMPEPEAEEAASQISDDFLEGL